MPHLWQPASSGEVTFYPKYPVPTKLIDLEVTPGLTLCGCTDSKAQAPTVESECLRMWQGQSQRHLFQEVLPDHPACSILSSQDKLPTQPCTHMVVARVACGFSRSLGLLREETDWKHYMGPPGGS